MKNVFKSIILDIMLVTISSNNCLTSGSVIFEKIWQRNNHREFNKIQEYAFKSIDKFKQNMGVTISKALC